MGDVTNGIIIDARDFGVVADFAGDEQTATDNGAALQAALNAAAVQPHGYNYDQVGGGAEVWLPKGWLMISAAQIVIPTGVRLKGATQYGTGVHIPTFYPAANGWIFDIGDHTKQAAAFSCGIQDLAIRALPQNAGSGATVIWTNNAQDTKGIVSNCRINAGNRTAIVAEIGYGGATNVNFDNCVLGNDGGVNGGIVNPVMRTNYGGGTEIVMRNMQWYGPSTPNFSGHYGLQIGGGEYDIKHAHCENVQFGIAIANGSGSMTTIEKMQGNSNSLGAIVVEDPTPFGNVEVRNIYLNGSTFSLADGRSGRNSLKHDIKGAPGWQYDSALTA